MTDKKHKGINYKNVRLVKQAKNAKVKDPPRFPNVINPIETQMKAMFNRRMNMAIVDFTKTMVSILKPKK